MTDLLTMLRAHDLPPMWDGLAVVWDGWATPAPVFICRRGGTVKPSTCEACGSTARSLHNRGRVARLAIFTHAMIRAADQAQDRLPAALRHKVRPRALVRLYAYRCPDCQLDHVDDLDTGQLWALDHTDYGDDGSHA